MGRGGHDRGHPSPFSVALAGGGLGLNVVTIDAFGDQAHSAGDGFGGAGRRVPVEGVAGSGHPLS